jgi:hypothetical protein
MMSQMEKHAQIGKLITQRQSQKSTLEHLKLKGKKIAAAYQCGWLRSGSLECG